MAVSPSLSRGRSWSARLATSDAGVTLIELMAAIVVFGIAATGLAAGFIAAGEKTRVDQNRVAASNLAAREIEIVRNLFTASSSGPLTVASNPLVTNPDPLAGGTAGQPLVVDHAPYTVTRRVQWVPAGTGNSTCDGGSSVTYPQLSVQVLVTWPNMGNVRPVEANTLLTPPKGVLSSSTGFVAVKILGATSQPQVNVPVKMTGPGGTSTAVTADDGCAVLATTTPGAYTVSLSNPGWVDFYGVAAPTKPATVTAGSITPLSFSYDQAGTLQESMTTASGYALPTGLRSLTVANTGLTPLGTAVKTVTGTGAMTIASLWPFSDGYTVWAGSCTQSDPAAAGGSRAPAVVIPPGGSATTTLPLAPTAITVQTTLGVAVSNATVTATPAATAGCASTENPLTLGVTNSSGVLSTSLPAGAWTIKVTGRTATSWPTTPTLLPSSGPTSVAVVVS